MEPVVSVVVEVAADLVVAQVIAEETADLASSSFAGLPQQNQSLLDPPLTL
jgi:hypothetical protein